MTKEKALAIVEEAKALGIAFVEDDFCEGADGEEIYNPQVDRPNAEAWVLDKFMAL